MKAECVHMEKVANGYLVIFHPLAKKGHGMPDGFVLELPGGRDEIDQIRKRAAEKQARDSGANLTAAEKITMHRDAESFIFLESELDKMLSFVKFILLAEDGEDKKG